MNSIYPLQFRGLSLRVAPPGCHTYLPHLKERSAVHIFSNTRVCFLLYSEERLEHSGESPTLKI